jgi:hypothetical protein
MVNENMVNETKKVPTRRELIMKLTKVVEQLIDDNKRMTEKLTNVRNVLTLFAQDPDVELPGENMKMDEAFEYDDDDPDKVEYEGVTFKKGDIVQLYDSKSRRWTTKLAKLKKFRAKQAFMVGLVDGKATRRAYGNFRLPNP